MRQFYTFLFFIGFVVVANSQPVLQIPLMRQIYHDNIDKSQISIEKLDKIEDGRFYADKNEEINLQINFALFQKIDNLQIQIERDSSLDINNKIKYLRGLNELLSLFESSYRYKQIKAFLLPDLIESFIEGMSLENKNESIENIVDKNPLEIGEILIRTFPYKANVGIPVCENILIRKQCEKNPDKILTILKNNPTVPFADSLIQVVAYKKQEELYNYASAINTPIGKLIQANTDSLVKIISNLALKNTGRMYFPFLDDLYTGKKKYADIDSLLDSEIQYFKLLVQTQINYANRFQQKDTPMVMHTLTNMLHKKAIDIFINEINGLHEVEDDKVRFKKLDSLSVEDLYYIAVLGEEEIYTSSYLRGVYDGIFKKVAKPISADSLLKKVHFNYFKKWIKMAAGFNTLDDFLKRMDTSSAVKLMKDFVNGLDKTESLEDAVDVADSYASITNPAIRNIILLQIENNLKDAKIDNNKKASNIYEILTHIFLSIDTANKIDLSKLYGVPPVYTIAFNSLSDSSGRIIVQQFFYGDKDGVGVFNAFLRSYKNLNWKIIDKPNWVEVVSLKGKPITIYANKPLDEITDLDAKAQAELNDYLITNNIAPTVIIHRGHSYNVKYTIEQLLPSGKIVLLGSCGGYHSLNEVLEICTDAHIISSKQVGIGSINLPMINSITETLRLGKDINWPLLWKQLEKIIKSSAKEKFDDYVPPHKNLGALFLKTYAIVSEKE
jgi:hypothetical protein